jgi:hypothetical protein
VIRRVFVTTGNAFSIIHLSWRWTEASLAHYELELSTRTCPVSRARRSASSSTNWS